MSSLHLCKTACATVKEVSSQCISLCSTVLWLPAKNKSALATVPSLQETLTCSFLRQQTLQQLAKQFKEHCSLWMFVASENVLIEVKFLASCGNFLNKSEVASLGEKFPLSPCWVSFIYFYSGVYL